MTKRSLKEVLDDVRVAVEISRDYTRNLRTRVVALEKAHARLRNVVYPLSFLCCIMVCGFVLIFVEWFPFSVAHPLDDTCPAPSQEGVFSPTFLPE